MYILALALRVHTSGACSLIFLLTNCSISTYDVDDPLPKHYKVTGFPQSKLLL